MKTAWGLVALAMVAIGGCDSAGRQVPEPVCVGLIPTCEIDAEGGVWTGALCAGEDTPRDCAIDEHGAQVVAPCPDGTFPVCE